MADDKGVFSTRDTTNPKMVHPKANGRTLRDYQADVEAAEARLKEYEDAVLRAKDAAYETPRGASHAERQKVLSDYYNQGDGGTTAEDLVLSGDKFNQIMADMRERNPDLFVDVFLKSATKGSNDKVLESEGTRAWLEPHAQSDDRTPAQLIQEIRDRHGDAAADAAEEAWAKYAKGQADVAIKDAREERGRGQESEFQVLGTVPNDRPVYTQRQKSWSPEE